MVNLEKDFFREKSGRVTYFNENIFPMEYENVLSKIFHVVDYFEIMYEIEIIDFMEVYSRYFVEEICTVKDYMLNKYYG